MDALKTHDVVVRRAWIVAGVWLAAFTVATALTNGSSTGRQVVGDGAYLVPVAGAAGLSIWVAWRGGAQRRLWTLLAASNVLWLAGELIWSVYAFVVEHDPPFPSVADAAYLASYALVPIAVVAGFRQSGARSFRALIDGLIVALAVGYTGWALLIRPQVGSQWSLATATGIAYPLLGVVILIVLGSTALGRDGHVPRGVLLVGVAFVISALTDGAYTYLSNIHRYLDGSWLNIGWQAEAVVLCVAALVAVRRDDAAMPERLLDPDVALWPVAGAVGVLVVGAVVDGLDGTLQGAALVVSGLTMSLLTCRLGLSLREQRRASRILGHALAEQERLAVTDGLTGLYNRRFAAENLALEVHRAARSRRPLSIVMIDLDAFKQVNDRQGHAVGDAALGAVARRLAESVRSTDVVARFGGEEFLVIAPDTESEAALELAERCRRRVAEARLAGVDGAPLAVTISAGVATLTPGENVNALMQRADRCLYAAKASGRNQVVADTAEMPHGGSEPDLGCDPTVLATLSRVADAVDAKISVDEHSTAVARWSIALAHALGLSDAEIAPLALAARLHDIGKIEIADAVLQKPAPLDEAEWHLMRRHPDTGADLAGASLPPSVAAIIRAHHERADGRGYPNGLTLADIPLEARILSVCDAYAAMTARRPYAPAKSPGEAVEELARGAGSQFDPLVVDAFLVLFAERRIDRLTHRFDPVTFLVLDAGQAG